MSSVSVSEEGGADHLEISDDGRVAKRTSRIGLEEYDEMLEETSAEELERVKEQCRTNKHVKPPYSYIALITMAVLQVWISENCINRTLCMDSGIIL